VTERFYEVMHLLKPPTALFTPAILWKLATRRRPRRVAASRSDFEAFARER
jgi:hypothetical protein